MLQLDVSAQAPFNAYTNKKSADSGNDNACCPDMDFASLRPAPFYHWEYTEEEIERSDSPD